MTNNIDYKMLKKQNLAQLVHEYETESNEIARKAQAKRTADIRLLEAHAQVKSLDFQYEQDDELFQIDKTMIKHFRNIEEQMVRDYKVYDLAARAYAEAYKKIQCTSRKSRPEIVTPHDLKMYVHSFNNQHRK